MEAFFSSYSGRSITIVGFSHSEVAAAWMIRLRVLASFFDMNFIRSRTFIVRGSTNTPRQCSFGKYRFLIVLSLVPSHAPEISGEQSYFNIGLCMKTSFPTENFDLPTIAKFNFALFSLNTSDNFLA